MITPYIKTLINDNKNANEAIVALEEVAAECKIENDKDKANFGNICVALRGYRMIADATEAMLINENVLKDEDGNFYQKIEDEVVVPPSSAGMPGSDHDLDKGTKKINNV